VEHAKELALNGFFVFPLQYGGKVPFEGTRGFLDASMSIPVIEQDFSRYGGKANIGIATGQSQLVVIDVDPRHGGEDSWAELSRNFSRFDTLEQQTGGGGRQLFFRSDPAYTLTSTAKSFGNEFDGVDLRAQGGYVVAPPSLHPSGARYLWDAGASDIVPIPHDIAEFLFEKQSALREMPKQALAGKVKAGCRNTELTRVAGLLRRHGLSAEQMFPSLNLINKQACVPPLSEREVWLICNSIGRKAPEHELFQAVSALRMAIRPVVDLRSRRQEWLVDGYIPRAELTIFEGRGGLGKSTTALDILARLSTGRVLPGGSRTGNAERSLLIAEEDSGTLVRARLAAAGADLSNIFILDGLVSDGEDDKLPFQVPRDTQELKNVITENNFNVVYIDALFNCFEKRYSANSSQDVRVVVGGLAKLAHDTGCTIIVTRHVGKADRHDKDKGLGSVDIGNVARSVILFDEVGEESPTLRKLHVSKHNYGKEPMDLLYEFETVSTYDDMGQPMEVAKVKWIGLEEFQHTNEEIFDKMKGMLDG
jgi:hypothetical protein